ncbi:uncharacterized protein BCR38DRAFT_524286 [Pseudomassariella vexata]|uniref:Tetraspanin n=1 Tax=Pseudomassariella vexata TaxID=1141098 RepID=A0A1Y2DY06_9PEZI|nr:uncharacterized protein BCR38DRAFT_524286 [Pseudomassariella vexata]ORY64188.1 hypothetical protein BCR38DRAFT_524286 [Pseudomassariella vexata]
MANPMLMYPLLIAALVAVAIYVQATSSNLSLPISLGTSILTILLPFIATANVFFTPLLQRLSFQEGAVLIALRFLPPTLHILQGILTVVLATISFMSFLPGMNMDCNMRGAWGQLWSAHDGRSISRIQDSFNCCGFNSIHLLRHPWREAMQRNAGLDFTVAVVVGILQMIHLAMFRLRNSQPVSRKTYNRLVQSVGAQPDDALLEDGEEDSINDAGDHNNTSHHPRGYGALNNTSNPRLEPSGLGGERNEWS